MLCFVICLFFFFKQKTAYEMRISDWSSDVCSSDLSNTLSGSVTVIVTRVLPNGNLVVRGEKQVSLNKGAERVALEGIVRPIDIAANNSVTSDRIANARISYAGNGAVADANEVRSEEHTAERQTLMRTQEAVLRLKK